MEYTIENAVVNLLAWAVPQKNEKGLKYFLIHADIILRLKIKEVI